MRINAKIDAHESLKLCASIGQLMRMIFLNAGDEI